MDKIKIYKFNIFPLILFGVSLLYFTGCQKSAANDKESEALSSKVNVVFILADDLGAFDLSITGSTFYETPNIDRIATTGTIFTQGYATCSVCSPSRASIMTGQFTARHGVTDWIGAASGKKWRENGRNNKLLPPAYNHSIAKNQITIAETFQANGYKTFFAGKWHLGDTLNNPEDHGFEINKGGWEVGSPKGGYFSPWINPKLENKVSGENLSIRLAKETADFIQQNKDEPFFAFLSFYAVHSPIQTSKERWQKYRDKAEENGIALTGFKMERVLPIRTTQDNPVYAGLISQMDDAVGIVLQRLKDLGLEQNTIIVFTSDNGGVASGDAYSTTNLPLRGGKGYQWEGGIREPYLIKVPFVNNAPREVDYPVTGADFYPTLLDFAGISPPQGQFFDGLSLKPFFEQKKLDQRPLFWHYPHYGNQGGEPVSMIRKGDLKLIYYWEDGHSELYNLKNDPGEQNDIAKKNPDLVDDLYTELSAYLHEVEANRPQLDKEFNQSESDQLYDQRVKSLLPRLEAQRKETLSRDFQPNETWWNSKIISN